MPLVLDELQDRDVIIVGVIYVPTPGVIFIAASQVLPTQHGE